MIDSPIAQKLLLEFDSLISTIKVFPILLALAAVIAAVRAYADMRTQSLVHGPPAQVPVSRRRMGIALVATMAAVIGVAAVSYIRADAGVMGTMKFLALGDPKASLSAPEPKSQILGAEFEVPHLVDPMAEKVKGAPFEFGALTLVLLLGLAACYVAGAVVGRASVGRFSKLDLISLGVGPAILVLAVILALVGGMSVSGLYLALGVIVSLDISRYYFQRRILSTLMADRKLLLKFGILAGAAVTAILLAFWIGSKLLADVTKLGTAVSAGVLFLAAVSYIYVSFSGSQLYRGILTESTNVVGILTEGVVRWIGLAVILALAWAIVIYPSVLIIDWLVSDPPVIPVGGVAGE